MISKMVLDRVRSSITVERSAIALAPKVAPLLVAGLGDGIPLDPVPDFEPLLRFVGQALERSRRRLEEAESAHTRLSCVGAAHRLRRDRANAELRTRLKQIRGALHGAFGYDLAAARQALGPTSPSAGFEALLREADRLVDALQRPELAQAAQARGCGYDAAILRERLEGPRRELAEACEAALDAHRSAISTLAVKERAMADHDLRFRLVSRFVASVFALAEIDAGVMRPPKARRRPERRPEILAAGSDAATGTPS